MKKSQKVISNEINTLFMKKWFLISLIIFLVLIFSDGIKADTVILSGVNATGNHALYKIRSANLYGNDITNNFTLIQDDGIIYTQSYIMFNISGLIPSNAIIQNTTLYLYIDKVLNPVSYDPPYSDMQIYACNQTYNQPPPQLNSIISCDLSSSEAFLESGTELIIPDIPLQNNTYISITNNEGNSYPTKCSYPCLLSEIINDSLKGRFDNNGNSKNQNVSLNFVISNDAYVFFAYNGRHEPFMVVTYRLETSTSTGLMNNTAINHTKAWANIFLFGNRTNIMDYFGLRLNTIFNGTLAKKTELRTNISYFNIVVNPGSEVINNLVFDGWIPQNRIKITKIGIFAINPGTQDWIANITLNKTTQPIGAVLRANRKNNITDFTDRIINIHDTIGLNVTKAGNSPQRPNQLQIWVYYFEV